MTVINTQTSLSWDLHCHTSYSDGTETPATLVSEAKRLGLEGVAISDHDTTAGWEDFRLAASALDFPVLYGSEITAQEPYCFDGEVMRGINISVHMLAYQYDPNDSEIVAMFAATRARRIERTKLMVERMAHDFPITWDDVISQAGEGELTTIGRPHIADALVKAGVYETRSEAFADAVSPQSKYYIPTQSPRVIEVIKAVKHAGGVSFIAHPADTSRNRVLLCDEQIIEFAEAGLDGLEVYHRGNTLSQRSRLLAIAKDCDLLVTGGSDWHGAGKPNILGEKRTDRGVVKEIQRRGRIEYRRREI